MAAQSHHSVTVSADNVNFELLREQRNTLLYLVYREEQAQHTTRVEHLNGLINLLDTLIDSGWPDDFETPEE